MPPEAEPNECISNYLFIVYVISNAAAFRLVKPRSCEIQVPVLKPEYAANRYPDLVILREEHLELTHKRLTITLTMPPPESVVEVGSPGKANRDRDYQAKREQYAARDIPEYWIVDPDNQVVIVLRLKAGMYVEVGRFQGNKQIISPGFPTLELTAEQILHPVFK